MRDTGMFPVGVERKGQKVHSVLLTIEQSYTENKPYYLAGPEKVSGGLLADFLYSSTIAENNIFHPLHHVRCSLRWWLPFRIDKLCATVFKLLEPFHKGKT
ncbi:unnamed protein product [Larinioides sclopetarius]|uniref:Uncharacterized protein n=1 Tax=Larinioides sclopetarius TaxID=280406 RepID=A0AAV2B2K7_9ARAC